MPIAWHPSRYWDWCMSEDEKKRDRKIVSINMDFYVSGYQTQKLFWPKKEQQIKNECS